MNNKLKHSVIKYLNSEFGDMYTFDHRMFPEDTFYLKGLKIYFDYDDINHCLNVNYNYVWKVLQNYMGLECEEVRVLLMEWFIDKYKLNITQCHYNHDSSRWHFVELCCNNEKHGYPY
jgi:hypothetical protein